MERDVTFPKAYGVVIHYFLDDACVHYRISEKCEHLQIYMGLPLGVWSSSNTIKSSMLSNQINGICHIYCMSSSNR